jgi:hypothetical protein
MPSLAFAVSALATTRNSVTKMLSCVDWGGNEGQAQVIVRAEGFGDLDDLVH